MPSTIFSKERGEIYVNANFETLTPSEAREFGEKLIRIANELQPPAACATQKRAYYLDSPAPGAP